MPEPAVSIVVPAYNLADCLPRCLDSLLAQTYDDFEIICVDDCSTDDTLDVLKRYMRLDKRIRTLHMTKNAGASAARNEGVRRARAQLVTFVDGDDFVSPHYLATLMEAYDVAASGRESTSHTADAPTKNHAPSCLVKARNLRGPLEDLQAASWEKGSVKQMRTLSAVEALRELLLERITVVVWACLIPRSLLLEHPFPKGMVFEDHYVIFDYLSSVETAVLVDTPIYAYVTRPVSTSNPTRHDLRFPRDMAKVAEHILERSASWDPSLHAPVVWACAWRLALAVSFCYDIDQKSRVRDIYRFACRYLRAHMLTILSIARTEHLDKGQLGKVIFAALSPHLYWGTRIIYRTLKRQAI